MWLVKLSNTNPDAFRKAKQDTRRLRYTLYVESARAQKSMMAIALNDFITYAIFARAKVCDGADAWHARFTACHRDNQDRHPTPLGACATTEKMLVTCHANSEQVPPMTPTTAEGQLQSDPWSQHRDLDQSGARNGRTLGHNTAP